MTSGDETSRRSRPEIGLRYEEGSAIYDLTEQRERALARAVQAIEEMEQVKRGLSKDAPGLYLVDGILKGLLATKARLEGGLPGRHRRSRQK